jgi:serine/threonine protein kinase/tetratricopeptide (TPR) repeat protein
MRALTDPFVGRTIAQYDILARVGGGAMGVVYQARDVKLGRLVALKFLPQQWSHDESAKQRFVREAQAASATQHPNICTVHDIETADDGQLFIVMAFYEGPTLKQRLENGPMAVEEALEIATQIADGLGKAHAQGVVHRDIKPGNVMLTEDGVRILDFGLATFVDALKLTVENTSFGTPAYMSPEQVRGHAADARSDVWAAGVVLYEMLAGHVPFQGSHPEAIAHAIRNEAPELLHAKRPEVPEDVEQLVFRALHKDPAVRFQNGRQLARSLHHVRGVSLPLELRTVPVVSPSRDRSSRTRPPTLVNVVIAAMLAGGVGAALWITRPVERIAVVVAPVSNQTGFEELQPFRLALTNLLTVHLSDSESVRVVPYERVLQVLRRFLFDRADVASRDVVEAIAADSGARFVLVPTLQYDAGIWKARIEVRAPDTGLNVHTYQTAGVSTSIATDAAFALMRDLAVHVDQHLSTPRVAARKWFWFSDRSSGDRSVRSLEAARYLEEGLRAYHALEFAAARRAFTAAAERDRRSALAMAWLTRVDLLMRQDDEAGESAARALALIDAQTPRDDSLFTEAVTAEVRQDFTSAEARYRALARRYADEPSWLMELAGFQDRRTQNAEAIATYHQALTLDSRLTRARLELCRLYSPNRTNEPVRAKAEGEQALNTYRRLGDKSGEAQALFCLVDVLRVGGAAERAQALTYATSALEILDSIGHEYNRARAENYLALIAGSGGDMTAAVTHWERALDGARATGNRLLTPRVLNNLGVAYQALGDRARAVESYRQSYALNEELGDQQEAARTRANAGAILIEYGNIEEGLRDVQSAQRVAENLADKTFEVLCLQLIAAYHRQTGSYDEATRVLTRALNIAVERGLATRMISSAIDLARVHLDAGRYEEARGLLVKGLTDASGRESPRAHTLLGLVHLRVGRFDAAESEFALAIKDVRRRGDVLPLLRLSLGELAYERGQMARAKEELRLAATIRSEGGLSDSASTEAGALLDVFAASAAARSGIDACIRESEEKRRISLQARCRVYQARALVRQRASAMALDVLSHIPGTSGFDPGPEVMAQIHHWRAEALAQMGKSREAASERVRASSLIATVRQSLPSPDQQTFLLRRDLRTYLQN